MDSIDHLANELHERATFDKQEQHAALRRCNFVRWGKPELREVFCSAADMDKLGNMVEGDLGRAMGIVKLRLTKSAYDLFCQMKS